MSIIRPVTRVLLLSVTAVMATYSAAWATPQHADHNADRASHRAALFSQADSNKDGQLSLAEFNAMPKPAQQARHAWKKQLKAADSNRDGQWSKAEVDGKLPMVAAQFSQIDSDHNGLLTKAELKTHHQAMRASFQRQ